MNNELTPFHKAMIAQKEANLVYEVNKSMDNLGFEKTGTTNADNSGSAHVNYLLSNLSVRHMQDSNKMWMLMPNIPSAFKTNEYRVYDKRDAFASHTRKSGELERPVFRNTRAKTESFSTDVYRIGEEASDELLGNDDLMEWWKIKVKSVAEDSALHREEILSDLVFTASNWEITKALSANEQFDSAMSTPIQLFREYAERVRLNCGKAGNVAILDKTAARVLLDNSQIVGRSDQTSSPEKPTDIMLSTLAKLFQMDMVYILDCIIYEGDLDSTTAKNTYVAPQGSVWIGWLDAKPSRDTMTAFTQFSWTGLGKNKPQGVANDGANKGSSSYGTRVRAYRDEDRSASKVVQDNAFGMKVITPSAGALLTNCVSSSAQITL